MSTLPEQLVATLVQRGLTCATAESCTGGGVGHAITAVPGSSAVFLGGIISYANSVKRDLLGVPQAVLDGVGPVSAECALAMARGARERLSVDLAVSITGLAGPDGDGVHPVGCVWFGLATKDGADSRMMEFPGDRAAVRAAAVDYALTLLLDAARKIF